jgi:tetratricopeptide (TPR) repeat protein
MRQISLRHLFVSIALFIGAYGCNFVAAFHNELGFALVEEGQLDEAIAEFRKSIELQPDFTDAHYNLGLALRHAGQEEEAQRHLDEAQRLGYDSWIKIQSIRTPDY